MALLKRGLVASVLILSSSLPVFAERDPHEQFIEELRTLEEKVKTSHCKDASVHIKVREAIDYDVKQYYEKELKQPWYEEVDILTKAVQDNYCKNFGVCIDIVAIQEWTHTDALTLEALMQETLFIPPEGADVVIGLTKARRLITGTIGRTEMRGNYSAICVDKQDGLLTFLHEFAHLFGVTHVNDITSIMYEQASGTTKKWDPESKRVIMANKYRSWTLPETKTGLHSLASHMDQASLKKLKGIYRLFGLQSLVRHDKKKQAWLWQTAEERTAELIVKYPTEGYLHFMQGEIYLRMDNEEKAISNYEKALELGIEYAVLQNNLACHYAEKKPERALQLAQNAVTKEPTKDEFRETLGWAYYCNKRYDDAERELTSITTLDNNAEYQYHLAMTYDTLNKRTKAKEAFRKVIEFDKEGELKKKADAKLKEYKN